jgi:hypothetical protein
MKAEKYAKGQITNATGAKHIFFSGLFGLFISKRDFVYNLKTKVQLMSPSPLLTIPSTTLS